jgi:beta-glucosidase
MVVAGEEAGHGFWDVVLGRVSPSARLPVTAYANEYLSLVSPMSDFNLLSADGVGRTYRWFNNASLVRYHFGYGLAYCTFKYTNLDVSVSAQGVAINVTVTASPLSSWKSSCQEVVQAYVSLPSQPVVETPLLSLLAFDSVLLPLNSPLPVSLTIPFDRLMTTFTNGTQVLAAGTYSLSVSGHQPADAAGAAASNVLTTTFALP